MEREGHYFYNHHKYNHYSRNHYFNDRYIYNHCFYNRYFRNHYFCNHHFYNRCFYNDYKNNDTWKSRHICRNPYRLAVPQARADTGASLPVPFSPGPAYPGGQTVTHRPRFRKMNILTQVRYVAPNCSSLFAVRCSRMRAPSSVKRTPNRRIPNCRSWGLPVEPGLS